MSGSLVSVALGGGDWVIWGLGASSIVAGAVIIDRFKVLRAEVTVLRALRAPLLKALEDSDMAGVKKALEQNGGFAARVLGETISVVSRGPDAVRERLAAAISDERRALEHRLLWLGTLGNNAPFLGLFGTVLGVIKAFHDLAESGAGPEVVMAGLSEALVATAAGLLVALPCVFAFNFLHKRTRDLIAETESLGRRLNAAGLTASRK